MGRANCCERMNDVLAEWEWLGFVQKYVERDACEWLFDVNGGEVRQMRLYIAVSLSLLPARSHCQCCQLPVYVSTARQDVYVQVVSLKPC